MRLLRRTQPRHRAESPTVPGPKRVVRQGRSECVSVDEVNAKVKSQKEKGKPIQSRYHCLSFCFFTFCLFTFAFYLSRPESGPSAH